VVRHGSDSVAVCERHQHAPALLRARRKRLLAHDVRPVLECEERLLGVQRVRGADVHDVDRLGSQEVGERVVRSHTPHLVRELL